ncbi:hypothetical protein CBR_g32257 [Chara braunii]|uniref:Ubiquitin-like protease family profile domain-containing protein n=1 Tax=Chara braunii TaxID=69332 RepID=A0A388JN86_CHABU|nr:hypothetical protein CBR_g32257 [Chara braunii]|eukprot:GBG59241.1 hypothetical protein CBR_g32257 [Chara braunii]
MLPFYTAITSDLEPTILLRVFFDEWERVVQPARCLDVPQEHRISMPISYVGDDEDRTRTSEMSTVVATKGATGVLDPSYVPKQPEPSGAYEESEPEGEAVERRHAEGAVADVAQGPVSATNEPSTGAKTTGVSTSGGDHEVAEQPRDMGKRPVAVGEKRSGEESDSRGAGDEHRQAVQSDKKKRKTSTPRQTSDKKRKSRGRKPETPKARRGGGTGEGSSKDTRARADENDSEDDKEKVVDLDAGYFLEWKEGVKKDVTLSINPERVLELPAWERPYNHRSIDPTHTAYILRCMMDAFKKKGKTYEKPILKLAPIVGLSSPGRKVVRVTPVDNPNEHWCYAVSGQQNVKVALELRNHEIWEKHTFSDRPFKPLYFTEEDFDGYTQINVNENRKDKLAPPRAQRLSMADIRQEWNNLNRPRAVTDNIKFKKDLVAKYEEFQKAALRKTPYFNLWGLADEKSKKKEWTEKLRYYLPLVMTDEETWKLGMKFYDEWEKGHTLAPDGAVWTKKPPTADPKVTREGQSFAEDNDGHKRVVYNIGSKKLIEQGKVGMKDACEMVKQDRMLLRLWHIVQFQHEGRDNDDWNDSFFRTKEQLMAEYASKGLDEKLWAGCRKWVTDHSYLKECPQCLGCPSDKDVAATMKLVNHEKFPTEWKLVVMSVLKGERSKIEEGPQALGECTNVKWKHTSQVTTLAPFAYDAFTAFLRKDEMRKVVTQLRCHTCIIDFCDPVDRARWNEEAFRSLVAFLEAMCPDFWTLIAFVPRQWDLSFMGLLHILPVTNGCAEKWVRRSQVKKHYQIGNSVWAEEDRMYVLFHGDDLKLNTPPTYEGRLPDDDAAALGKSQKCTPLDIAETQFTATTYGLAGVHHIKGFVYKEMERHPVMLLGHIEFFCPIENGVMFIGKAHAQVVWQVLKSGRHVVAIEGDTKLLNFLMTYVAHEVHTGVDNCEFYQVQKEVDHDPDRNMWFKLSAEKRASVYKFLFLDTRPKLRFDDDYKCRRDVVIGALDGYHDASREAAANFVEKLEECYFDNGRMELKLNYYKAQFTEEDNFIANDEEEVSKGEEPLDLETVYHKYTAGMASSSTPSSSKHAACSPVVTPVATPTSGSSRGFLSSMRSKPLSPTVKPKRPLPLTHTLRLQKGQLYFFGKTHRSTDESDWGHHIVWHPDVFQPAVIDSEWVMAFNDKGEWKSEPRLSKNVFEEAALQAVIDHVAEVNCRQPDEFVVKMFGEQTYEILREHSMLELCRDFFYLETSPSYEANIDCHIPPRAPTRGEGAGRGGRGGDDEGGDGGGEDRTHIGSHSGYGEASDNRGGGARRENITSAGGVTIAGGMGGMASAKGASSQTGQGSPQVESPPPMHALQASELVGQGQHAFPSSGCIRGTVSAGSNFMADVESVDMASTKDPGRDTRECEVVTDATLLDGENVVDKPVGGSYSTERTDSLASPCATGSEVDKGRGLRVGIFSVGTGCIRHASGLVSVEQTEDLVAGSFSAGGGYIRSSARQLSSTDDTLALGTEDQETAPFDTHYGGSEGGHVSLTEPAEKPAGGSYFPQMGFEGHKERGLRDGGSFVGAGCIRRPSLRDNAERKEHFVVGHTSQQTRSMDNTLALNMEDQQTPPLAHQPSSTDDTLALGMEDQEAAPFDTHYGGPEGGHVLLTIASKKPADRQKGHGVRDGGSFVGARCIRRRSLRVGAEQTPPPTEQQPRSTDNTPALGVEDQETPPRDAHCGGSQGGYVSHLCSVVSDQCKEDEDVTMLERDEVAVRRPIEGDLVKTLFREFDSLVVISPSSQLLTPQDEVLTIRGSAGTAGRPVELCPGAPEKVVCLVDADIKDLSRFSSRLNGIMASAQTEEFVLGLSATCLGKDLPQSKDLNEKEHLRHEAVAGKQ